MQTRFTQNSFSKEVLTINHSSIMTVDRITRVNELIRREIGEALFHIMNEESFDLAAVTVTSVRTSRNLRNAKVMVSVRDHKDDRSRMLSMLRKHRCEIQQMINHNLTLKYTPRLAFELDESLEKGDHILGLLSELEREEGHELEQKEKL